MKNLLFSLFLFLFAFSSCGGDHDHSHDHEKEGNHSHEHGEAHHDDAAAPAEALAVTISDFGVTQDYPNAKLESMEYKGGKFTFGVKDYELASQTPDATDLMCANSDKGQHIHLIIDNEPYFAKYEASFDQKVEDGEHIILAFLSRSYHESVKVKTASIAKKVAVKGGYILAAKDIKEPVLFYSRPKGTYVGKGTKKVLLDFYPYNVTLGEDYKVKVNVNGGELATLDEWKPYALENLPMGENTVTLTLVNGSGEMVNAPMNPVTRKFTLKEDPTEGLSK